MGVREVTALTLTPHFATHGVAIIEYALVEADLVRMAAAFSREGVTAGSRQDAISGDLRDWLAAHPALIELSTRLAGAEARLVRCLAFDKSPAANWFVPWHQDRSIAVAARVEAQGYDNLTIKDGTFQVEPPVPILEGMVTLRIHLDDCDEDNGPLEAIPGSQSQGRLDRAAIASTVESRQAMLCLCSRGDILAMRPLTVHRSQKARMPRRRRVLHLEYATATLAPGLSWALPTLGHG